MDQPPTLGSTEPIQPTVIAGTKRSFSKKQKTGLFIGGFVALLGVISLGSWYYSDVVLNAAGEESLGSNVVVNLPQPNESAYFKITAVGRQNVAIELTGDAKVQSPDNASAYRVRDGWAIEQSSDPTNSTSWFTVMDSNNQVSVSNAYFAISSKCAYEAKKIFNPTLALSNDQLLQPNHTYYFRAVKHITTTDGDGLNPVATTEQQGNIVSFTTKAEPTFNVVKGNDTQVTLNWTDAQSEPGGCDGGQTHYAVVRTSNLGDLSSNLYASGLTWSLASYNTTTKPIGKEISTDPTLAVGSLALTQPKGSTYYYSLIRMSGYTYGDSYEQIGVAQPITIASTTSMFSGTTSLSKTSVRADQLSLTTTTTVKNAPFTWQPQSTVTVKTWASSKYGECTVRFISQNNYKVKDATQTAYQSGSCTNIVPGAYTVKTNVIAENSDAWNDADRTLIESTNDNQLVLSKVPANIQINFLGSATVKYKKDVVISIFNRGTYGAYTYLPAGQLTVKNLNTGKVIKTITLSANTSSTKITLKGVKKGKYKLAVIFTPSTSPAIFEGQTTNLPTLTVK